MYTTWSDLRLLYELQSIDEQMKDHRRRAEQCPAATAVDRLRTDLEKVDRAIDRRDDNLKRRTRKLRHLELELQTIEDRIDANEKKMLDGSVREARSLTNLQDMITADRRIREETEEDALLTMERIEEIQAELDKARIVREKVLERLNRAKEKLVAVEDRRRREGEKLENEREALLPFIADEALKAYSNLATELSRPISKVLEKTCSGCHMTLPTSMRKPQDDSMARCPHCGRILYWSDHSSADETFN